MRRGTRINRRTKAIQLFSNNGSTATHKCTQQSRMLLNKAGERSTREQIKQWRATKEYLGLPSGVRGLEEKSNGKGQRENLKTHQYCSCIVIMHALHDGKPCLSH